MRDGEPWFVAADVCKALEIGNPSQALVRLEDDEKFTTLVSNEGAASGTSSMAFVNEPGLYSLVLGSRKPEAKVFKRWITHDVIPSIRKHGAYLAPEVPEQAITNPDFMIGLFTALKSESCDYSLKTGMGLRWCIGRSKVYNQKPPFDTKNGKTGRREVKHGEQVADCKY